MKKTTAALQDFLNARCGYWRICESYKHAIRYFDYLGHTRKHFGQDGIPRQYIEFINRFFPLGGKSKGLNGDCFLKRDTIDDF